MKEWFLFWWNLSQRKYYGEVYVKLKAGEIIHVELRDSQNIEPFKSGWEKPIPE
jgi:hypothetical protein